VVNPSTSYLSSIRFSIQGIHPHPDSNTSTFISGNRSNADSWKKLVYPSITSRPLVEKVHQLGIANSGYKMPETPVPPEAGCRLKGTPCAWNSVHSGSQWFLP